MAVSLVSTGIQFPDASIQTTAAGASVLTLISTTTSTSGTSVSFTGLTSSYRAYEIVFNKVQSNYNSALGSDGRYLQVQFSNNNGSSYISTGYLNMTTMSASSGSGQTSIFLGNSKTNSFSPSNENGVFTLYNPATATIAPTYSFYAVSQWPADAGYGNSNAGYDNGAGAIASIPPSTTINAIRFVFNSGASFIAGTWKLYGVT